MNLDNLFLVLGIITTLVLLISYVCKIEYHFKYLKIFYPDRLGKYKSRTDAQLRFFFAPDIDFELMIPIFIEKDEVKADQKEILNRLKRKIKNSLLTFWTTIAAVLTVALIMFYLK